MDELMLYNYLKSKGMEDMDEHEFMSKLKSLRNKYGKDDARYSDEIFTDNGHLEHMRRSGKTGDFMDMFNSDKNERFSGRFNDDMNDIDIHEILKYMKHSKNDSGHFGELEAKYTVSNMYHTENGRKYTGEKFSIHKAKELCEKYKGILPSSVTSSDMYVAINSQYHDYARLFKNWFGNNIEQKVIESAIIFWFKDADAKSENKLMEYFKGH